MDDFITYEQAVQLKELGFDWACIGFYNHYKIPCIEHYVWDEGKIIKENYNDNFIANTYNVICSAPTLAQVHKWLREKHNIDICIIRSFVSPNKTYYYEMLIDDDFDNTILQDSSNKTYEDALLAGINKALERIKEKQQ